ncbi:MAG: RNA polymerase sigma factor [Chitinophagales bacterium]
MFQQELTNTVKYLKPFALKLTHNAADSEDLLQETLFKALSNEGKFKEGTNLKAWLFTIMKNIFINDYRKKVKRPTLIDTTEGQFFLNSTVTTANTAVASIEKDNIMMVIRSLDIPYRVPFMLYYKGYKYDEIAEKLNLPIGTIKSRIFFARKQLKENLQDYRN